MLKFISDDNYMIRITKEEIDNYNPIIAYDRNGKAIEKFRLIIPGMRDMFWIQRIEEIIVEKEGSVIRPTTAFIAENLLAEISMRSKLPPFTDAKGYTFLDLIEPVFPLQQEDIILYGKDGVKHRLDFEKYLKNAVLVEDDMKFELKSVDFPGGMWIKNIAVIQQLDRIIVFRNQFENISETFALINLETKPSKLNVDSNVLLNTNFADEKWRNVKRITW